MDLFHFFIFFALLLLLTPLLGPFLASLFSGQRLFLSPCLGWLEHLIYRWGGIDPNEEMHWKQYAKAVLFFNFFGAIFLFTILLTQYYLPFNPQQFPGLPWLLALNTTISFVTNTNWQAYPGETTLSYASQMWGLTVQNFLSAATGLAVLMVFVRGLTRKTTENLGNFWVDLTRTVVYLFLPLSVFFSFVLISQGVVQTLSPYVQVETLEGISQTIPVGPVASQVAIKQLGSNGGGFFSANGAHPFENPTVLSNFLETLAIVLIPFATIYAYGLLIDSKKHAWMLLSVTLSLWFLGFCLSLYAEQLFPSLEGQELRFGVGGSVLWSTLTTGTSNGSVNAMLSSLSPLAGGVALFNMMLGELIFGGVGVGMCSLLMFVFLTIFLSGLMVGRTPEYLGKKIDKFDIKWVMLAVLGPGFLILIGTSIACVTPAALSSLANGGPHGFSEMLYAFTSAASNNGSEFAGLNANKAFYHLSLSLIMLLARLIILISSLALAGHLVVKRASPPSLGTLSTDTPLFASLLMGVILIVGALTFFPALALGPIAEHFLMLQGKTFHLLGGV